MTHWISVWFNKAITLLAIYWSIGLSFFMPIGGLIAVTTTAILMDWVIGTLTSIQSGKKLESKLAWRTPQKLLIAVGLVMGFHIIHVVMIEPLPTIPLIGEYIENLSLSYLVTFSILWSELLSLAEKLEKLFGWKILTYIEKRFKFLNSKS